MNYKVKRNTVHVPTDRQNKTIIAFKLVNSCREAMPNNDLKCCPTLSSYQCHGARYVKINKMAYSKRRAKGDDSINTEDRERKAQDS